MTPHNQAKKEDIAKKVLMPGDPLRAKWIATTFLKDAKLVNEVRGMYAFTGYFNNQKVTIMGHGMGIASIGIYSYELFKFYDVDLIVRIGSAGAYISELNLGDLLIVEKSVTDSTYLEQIDLVLDNAKEIAPSIELNNHIKDVALQKKIAYKEARVYSSDLFYGNKKTAAQIAKDTNTIAVEMEATALFANAKLLNKQAACLLTISDSLVRLNESMSPIERQTKFVNMVNLALESVTTYK